MSRNYSIFLLFVIMLMPLASESQTISGPEVKLVNNDLFVTFSIGLEDKSIEAMRKGVDKELKFYIDLFKVWKAWPDEFVLGKAYVRTVKVDPIPSALTTLRLPPCCSTIWRALINPSPNPRIEPLTLLAR